MNVPLVLLNRRRRGGAAAFTPAGLFALAEPGVWYDPSDLTTLFQDTAGTTPVTTPGQTVALALDKSKGLVLGSELVSNPGGPFVNTTGWLAYGTGSNFSVIGGNLVAVDDCYFPLTGLTVGRTYQVNYSVVSGGGVNLYVNADGTGSSYVVNRTGVGSARITVINPALGIYLNPNTTLASISVKELPGFHATQATLASRPTYGIVPLGGRRNLFERTEEFDNAYWTKTSVTVTANATTAPDSTSTADRYAATAISGGISRSGIVGTGQSTVSCYLKANGTSTVALLISTSGNGAIGTYNLSAETFTIAAQGTGGTTSSRSGTLTSVGNGWYRATLTATTSSGTNNIIIGGTGAANDDFFIWGAQLETGSSATAYQRVGSAFDVTEAGVASLSYLSFDGVDDFLITPTITPGIDRAQVFAGVRKLSDAAQGAIAEFSANVNTNNGSFILATGSVSAPGPNYHASSKGSILVGVSSTSAFAAPITNVIASLFDISGDANTLRLNGTEDATSASNQGTGNYLAYPLYIGRRGGTTLPFNGQIYSLLVRFGTNLDAGTITSTETWVAGKTGVTL